VIVFTVQAGHRAKSCWWLRNSWRRAARDRLVITEDDDQISFLIHQNLDYYTVYRCLKVVGH
jgi:hypothetical protein